MQLAIQRESETGVYRTRVIANVLCQWASRETGKQVVTPHLSEQFAFNNASQQPHRLG
jgi:hypothetical protein